MSEYTDIDGVDEIPDQNAGDLGNIELDEDLPKAKLKKPTDMKFLKNIKRYLKQSSTKSAIATVAVILGTVLGLDVDPSVLTQSLIGIVTGLAMVIASGRAIYDMFRDEDKQT